MFNLKKLCSFLFLVTGTTSVYAEGTNQMDVDHPQPLKAQSLLFVHVANNNDFIRLHLCNSDGNSTDVFADIYSTNLVNGKYVLDGKVADLTSTGANLDCADPMISSLPATPLIGDQMQYQAPSSGVYAIKFDDQTNGDDTFDRWDISVVSNGTDSIDPTSNDGNLFSYNWHFDTKTDSVDSAATTKMFVLIPGGFTDTNYVWALDLQKFAGNDYDIIANDIGLNSPYSGMSALINGITPVASITEKYPTYLSYPTGADPKPAPLPSQIPTISDTFVFTDSNGTDNAISPDGDSVEESGMFTFTPNVTGTYAITIDVNRDGDFGVNDKLLLGTMTANTPSSVAWDGTNAAGENVVQAKYDVKLQLRVGEYHFVAIDVETSGGGTQDGLTILQAIDADTLEPTTVYWDDETLIEGGSSNLPNGVLSSTDEIGEHRHTWGDFSFFGFGDAKYIDTYVFGNESTFTSNAIVENKSSPKITSDGAEYDALILVYNDTTSVTTVIAESEATNYIYSLLGKDSALFTISDTGVLTFNSATDYDNPTDENLDNDYIVVVNVNDGALNTQQEITVRVQATNEAPIALAQSLDIVENVSTPHTIILTGTDTDGDIQSYSVVTGPTNGILSGSEPSLMYTPNTDYFGVDSFTFTVTDNRLGTSTEETITLNVLEDFDGDGIADINDPDQDNDGIDDSVEGNTDTDGDGIVDYRDLDSDNDGIPDSLEGTIDTDSDGISDFKDLDSDNDTILDSVEGTLDTDGDSIPNYRDLDSDADGVSDEVENVIDTDNDTLPNYLDIDSDNDGLSDGDENNDFNADGIVDRLQSESAMVETGINGAGSINLLGLAGLFLIALTRCRKNLGIILIPVVTVFSVNVNAMDNTEDLCSKEGSLTDASCWYIGGGIEYSRLLPEHNGTGWRVTEKNDTGFTLFAGVALDEHWFAQLAYHDMGTAEMQHLNPAITNTLNIDYSALNASVGYWLNDRKETWNFYGKIGLAYLDTEEGQYVNQDHGAQLTFGVGVQWHLTESWFLRLNVDAIDKDARNIGLSISRYLSE